MPSKTIAIENIGQVQITKKRGMRSIRLKIMPDNTVAVSAPWFVSQREIVHFIEKKKMWIRENQTNETLLIRENMPIGLSGILSVERSETKLARVMIKERGVHVRLPHNSSIDDVHSRIVRQITRFLALETEESIFPRLLELAEHYGLDFNKVQTKKLTGRWGSCDSQKNIVINAYLVQLEEELVDYVLVHELAHTKQLNHSKEFWTIVEGILPDFKKRRNALKQYQPRIYDQSLRPRYNDAYA